MTSVYYGLLSVSPDLRNFNSDNNLILKLYARNIQHAIYVIQKAETWILNVRAHARLKFN